MLDLQRGQKISIQTVCRTWTLEVELRHQGPLAVDVSCFGLDSAGRLSDERYFLFYNQRRSPEGAMALSEGASGGTARFQVDLAALPDHIQRLSFTAAIDGGRTLRELEQGSIGVENGGRLPTPDIENTRLFRDEYDRQRAADKQAKLEKKKTNKEIARQEKSARKAAKQAAQIPKSPSEN